jgi:methyl-accepting chemotaxis protein
VVADEVRALAECTTKATREIGEMIKAIQREIRSAVIAMEQGVKDVEECTSEACRSSGKALQGILEQVNSVAMQVNQIATAAEQQTATTSEISGNIQQMTEVVNETATGTRETAASAGQLAILADVT